ncbi:MAG: hypothetical protein P8X43_10645, partial [Maritimibacter sp.]
MVDLFREFLSAVHARIRSPFWGSIAIVFVLVNWKVLFYLIVADQSVSTRLRFFELNSDPTLLYWIPLFVGLGFAIAAPWIRWIGAVVA